MTQHLSGDDVPELTPELAALDAELRGLHIRERASFGPELGAELGHRLAEMDRPTFANRFGRRIAVGGGSVLLLALVFSPARASISDLISSFLYSDAASAMDEGPMPPAPGGELVRVAPEPLLPPVREAESELAVTPLREKARVDAGALTVYEPAEFTVPKVADPNELKTVLEEHYPAHLQAARVGGKVRVRMWVDASGSTSYVQVRTSSGVPDLDSAAREAATHIVFEPARWLGSPVGTWVEFDVGFDPATVNSEHFALRRGKPDKGVL